MFKPDFFNLKIKIMRRSPFRTFFGISVGLILFFFLARVLVTAFFIAAAMSLICFVFRKIKNFFKYMTWEEREYYERNSFDKFERLEDEPLFDRRERVVII